MAVDFRDPKSGFRHCEVILFINEEVLRNGGGPGFYLTFRSRPWKDIEDGLKSVVADTHVPRTIKRACAWSALALGVRVATRQREKQSRRVKHLHNQVEKHEAATWTLATDLQRLREERDEVVSELRSARDNLKQVLHERDMLHKRLIEFELSQQLLAESQDTEYPGTLPWPLIVKEHIQALDTNLQSGQYAVSLEKAQMASVTDMPRSLSLLSLGPTAACIAALLPVAFPPPSRVLAEGEEEAPSTSPLPAVDHSEIPVPGPEGQTHEQKLI
ncbi:hypothetical protein HispidOSU_025455 [Sigmodon hispidus]